MNPEPLNGKRYVLNPRIIIEPVIPQLPGGPGDEVEQVGIFYFNLTSARLSRRRISDLAHPSTGHLGSPEIEAIRESQKFICF